MTDKLGLLDPPLLYSEYFFLTDSFHVSLHGSKDKVTGASLQRLVGLFADQNLAHWALCAHSSRLVDSGSDERELRLCLTDNASNNFTRVDTNLDCELLCIPESLRVRIALNTAGEISDSY